MLLINLHFGYYILLLTFFIENTLECDTIFIEPHEIVISNSNKYFIIESDYENQTINKDDIQYPLIQELDHFSFEEKAQIISTIIVPFLFKNYNLENQLCSLYKIEGYYISCISIERIMQEETEFSNQKQELQQGFSESLKFSILTQKDEVCEYIFQYSQFELLLKCNSLHRLIIYTINLNNMTVTQRDYEFDNIQYKFCQVKHENFLENSFLLIFYDCIQWAIYIYQDMFLNLIFNRDIAFQNASYFNIDFVENIQICQEKIVIIGNNQQFNILTKQYFIYSYESNTKLSFQLFGSYDLLKSVIFDRFCTIQYFLLESQLNNKIYIKNYATDYELEGIPKYIYFVSNLLFTINEEGLKITLNKKFIKQIQFKIFPLHFYYINNFFYQIDQESKTFNFYKYKIFNNLIINPSKKFLFYFPYNKQFIDETPSFCQQIQINQNQTQIQTYNYSFPLTFQCEMQKRVLIQKPKIQLSENFKIVIESDLFNLVESISDKEKFESVCRIPKKYLQNIRLLHYVADPKGYLIFETPKFLNFFDCDQELVQLYISNQKVINFKQYILLFNHQTDHIKFVKILDTLPNYQEYKLDNQYLEYKLDSNIQEVFFSFKYALIITKSLKKIELFDLFFFQNLELPSLLNQFLINIYINNMNKEGSVQNFYCKPGSNIFILQYYNQLILFKQKQINHFELKQQILSIIQLSSFADFFHIVAVDINQNCLLQFVLDQTDITLWNKNCLENSQFIYPITYQEYHNQIIIAITKNNCTFLNVFAFQETNAIKLKSIIQVSQKQFIVNQDQLFYFDINNEISILNLNYLMIQINPVLEQNSNFQINEKLIFHIQNEVSDNTKITFASNISLFFQCQKLTPLKNETSIILDNNNIIQLDELFKGAIEILKLEGNQNVLLEGPLLYSQQNNHNDELSTIIYNMEQYNTLIILITIKLNSNQRAICSIRINSTYQEIQFQKQYGIIQQAFYINKSQIIFFSLFEKQIQALIFIINQENLTIAETSDKLIITPILSNLEIKKLNNVFQIRQFQKQDYLYIENGKMLLLQNTKEIQNLIFIQNSDQLYLELKFQIFDSFLNILLIKIHLLDFVIIKQFDISLDQLLVDFDNAVKESYSNKQISVIDASINNSTLNITVLIMLQIYSTLYNIQIDLATEKFNFFLQKIIKNPSGSSYSLKFIDTNYLILNEGSSCYIYDFRPKKDIYYLTFFFELCQTAIYQYNTTHYIFYEMDLDIFTIGQIDYRIRILNNQSQTENCTLIAENSLSKAEITLHLIQNNSQSSLERSLKFSHLCMAVIVIVLFLYFLRRFFLKKTFFKNRKQFQFLRS